jgi:hypothetical protein
MGCVQGASCSRVCEPMLMEYCVAVASCGERRGCKIIRMLSSLTHSSRASTIRTYEDGDELLSSLDNGPRVSWRHWSRRDWFAISFCSVTASEMNRWICGTFRAGLHSTTRKELASMANISTASRELLPTCVKI